MLEPRHTDFRAHATWLSSCVVYWKITPKYSSQLWFQPQTFNPPPEVLIWLPEAQFWTKHLCLKHFSSFPLSIGQCLSFPSEHIRPYAVWPQLSHPPHLPLPSPHWCSSYWKHYPWGSHTLPCLSTESLSACPPLLTMLHSSPLPTPECHLFYGDFLKWLVKNHLFLPWGVWEFSSSLCWKNY